MDKLLSDITALGLVALMMLLVYYFATRVFGTLSDTLERQNALHTQQIIMLEKCAQELTAIKDSLSLRNGRERDVNAPTKRR